MALRHAIEGLERQVIDAHHESRRLKQNLRQKRNIARKAYRVFEHQCAKTWIDVPLVDGKTERSNTPNRSSVATTAVVGSGLSTSTNAQIKNESADWEKHSNSILQEGAGDRNRRNEIQREGDLEVIPEKNTWSIRARLRGPSPSYWMTHRVSFGLISAAEKYMCCTVRFVCQSNGVLEVLIGIDISWPHGSAIDCHLYALVSDLRSTSSSGCNEKFFPVYIGNLVLESESLVNSIVDNNSNFDSSLAVHKMEELHDLKTFAEKISFWLPPTTPSLYIYGKLESGILSILKNMFSHWQMRKSATSFDEGGIQEYCFVSRDELIGIVIRDVLIEESSWSEITVLSNHSNISCVLLEKIEIEMRKMWQNDSATSQNILICPRGKLEQQKQLYCEAADTVLSEIDSVLEWIRAIQADNHIRKEGEAPSIEKKEKTDTEHENFNLNRMPTRFADEAEKKCTQCMISTDEALMRAYYKSPQSITQNNLLR